MPVFVYVLLGIALLLVIIPFLKIRAYVCFDDRLRIYAKLWFIKINISIPELLEKSKQKKEKKKEKEKKDAEKKGVPYVPPINPVIESINGIIILLDAIFSFFLKKIHFRHFKIRIDVGCDDAATTALVHSYATQGVSYIIELLRNISHIDVDENSEICINANFISQKSDIEARIEFDFRLKDYLIFKYLSEKEPTPKNKA